MKLTYNFKLSCFILVDLPGSFGHIWNKVIWKTFTVAIYNLNSCGLTGQTGRKSNYWAYHSCMLKKGHSLRYLDIFPFWNLHSPRREKIVNDAIV